MNWLQYFQLKAKQKKVTLWILIALVVINGYMVIKESTKPECTEVQNICAEGEEVYYYPWKECKTYCETPSILLRIKIGMHTIYNNKWFVIPDIITAFILGWMYYSYLAWKLEKQNEKETEDTKNDDGK
jgi:hypothetical protein